MIDSTSTPPDPGPVSSKLASLAELARLLGNASDEVSVQNAILVGAMTLCDADYGSIQLFESGRSNHIHLDRWEGSLEGDLASRCDALIASWIAQNDSHFRSADLALDSRIPELDSEPLHTAVLACPIHHRQERIGAIILARPVGREFGAEEEQHLNVVSELVSSALFHIRHHRLVQDENRRLRDQLLDEGQLSGLLGRSPVWLSVCKVLRNAGPSEARMLLLGESGTGKEVCARSIHELSRRRERPFVAVNCAALPETLAESELFGYVKGAFTGAVSDRSGLFVEADGGTLFLDEVGSASAQVQSSLLRAIEESEIRPVGATTPRKVDVRLICATSCDLEAMVKAGTFRKDLYFRINVVSLLLPPLRQRREDIAPLASEFLKRMAQRNGRSLRGLSPAALVALEMYAWPGNVRELLNAMEHATLFTPPSDEYVPAAALPERILSGSTTLPGDRHDGQSLDLALAAFERAIVQGTLDRCGWNQSEAARVLGVSEKRIRTRIREFDLRPESGEGTPPETQA